MERRLQSRSSGVARVTIIGIFSFFIGVGLLGYGSSASALLRDVLKPVNEVLGQATSPQENAATSMPAEETEAGARDASSPGSSTERSGEQTVKRLNLSLQGLKVTTPFIELELPEVSVEDGNAQTGFPAVGALVQPIRVATPVLEVETSPLEAIVAPGIELEASPTTDRPLQITVGETKVSVSATDREVIAVVIPPATVTTNKPVSSGETVRVELPNLPPASSITPDFGENTDAKQGGATVWEEEELEIVEQVQQVPVDEVQGNRPDGQGQEPAFNATDLFPGERSSERQSEKSDAAGSDAAEGSNVTIAAATEAPKLPLQRQVPRTEAVMPLVNIFAQNSGTGGHVSSSGAGTGTGVSSGTTGSSLYTLADEFNVNRKLSEGRTLFSRYLLGTDQWCQPPPFQPPTASSFSTR